MAKWTQTDFIKAWVEASSMADVVEALGESADKSAKNEKKFKVETRLRLYASELRAAGIPLPQFRGPTKEAVAVDPEAGIKLLAQLTGKSEAEIRRDGKKVQEAVKVKADRARKSLKKKPVKK